MNLTKFARRFRWTLTPAGHDGAAMFCHRVRLDLFRNRLEVHAYDAQIDGVCPVMKWLVEGPHADLGLNFYDKDGSLLESLKLKAVKPIRHRLDLDQSSDKPCVHQMLFGFEKVLAVVDMN